MYGVEKVPPDSVTSISLLSLLIEISLSPNGFSSRSSATILQEVGSIQNWGFDVSRGIWETGYMPV